MKAPKCCKTRTIRAAGWFYPPRWLQIAPDGNEKSPDDSQMVPDRESERIRENQKESERIRENQRESGRIRENQRASERIRENQRE